MAKGVNASLLLTTYNDDNDVQAGRITGTQASELLLYLTPGQLEKASLQLMQLRHNQLVTASFQKLAKIKEWKIQEAAKRSQCQHYHTIHARLGTSYLIPEYKEECTV